MARCAEAEANWLDVEREVGQVGAHLREAGLGKRLAAAEERADRDETIRQLSRIGNNLNQIARVLNKDRGLAPEHLRAATDELREALSRV